MNKSHLITALGRVLSTKKECFAAANRVFEEIARAILRGERVTISGFGSFQPYISRARRVKDPRTGAVIDVPPKRRVRFVPSGDLF